MNGASENWEAIFESEQAASVSSAFLTDSLGFNPVHLFFALWVFFAFLSLLSYLVFFKVKSKLVQQREKEAEYFASKRQSEFVQRLYGKMIASDQKSARKQKWSEMKKLINSKDKKDRKLAILEADILLKDLLLHLGVKDDKLGAMLKSADEKVFPLLEEAWQAHKIRNKLAHDSMCESVRDADIIRAFSLYEKIFKKFDFV